MPHLTPYPGAPVIVIGNGPVGETAALPLARWGIPVIVLDRPLARDAIGSRAICQQRDVLDVWEAVGAGQQAAATTHRSRMYVHDCVPAGYDRQGGRNGYRASN